MFTGFLHNIQTSGAVRSGWHSWGRKDTSRTIRQLGNCSLKGICPNTANIPATAALAPTEPRRSPRAPICPRLAFLLFLLSDAVFSPAPAYCLLKETCSPSLRAAGELPVLPLFARLGRGRWLMGQRIWGGRGSDGGFLTCGFLPSSGASALFLIHIKIFPKEWQHPQKKNFFVKHVIYPCAA